MPILRNKDIEARLSGKELEAYKTISDLGDKSIIAMGLTIAVSYIGCWALKKYRAYNEDCELKKKEEDELNNID